MFTPSSIESVDWSRGYKKIFEISDSSKVAGSIIEDGKVTSKAFASYRGWKANRRSPNSKS